MNLSKHSNYNFRNTKNLHKKQKSKNNKQTTHVKTKNYKSFNRNQNMPPILQQLVFDNSRIKTNLQKKSKVYLFYLKVIILILSTKILKNSKKPSKMNKKEQNVSSTISEKTQNKVFIRKEQNIIIFNNNIIKKSKVKPYSSHMHSH